MGRFLAGFVTASLIWGGVAYTQGWIATEAEPIAMEIPPDAGVEEEEEASPMRRRRRRRRRGMKARGMDRDWSGNGSSGDDLGENDPREIDGAGSGGEEQLTGAQIEAGFDSVFGRIRRCLVLIPEDAPTRGRVTFGLRVASSGRVSRVNLQGPRSVTQSEAGGCLRQAARGISFPSFDGPDMIVRYPITLE
ncbi:MAG: hypothetical protein AAGE52_04715 [Myxococcota bacterium]